MLRSCSRTARGPVAACVALLAVALLTGCSGSKTPVYKQGDAYVLQMRATSGDAYDGVMAVDQTMDMNVRGQAMQMSQSQSMHYRYAVTTASADSMTMTRTLTRAHGSTTSPMGGGTQSFDTASDSTGAASTQLGAIVDLPVSMRMSRNGDVARVLGMQALIDSVATASGASGARAMTNQTLNPESMKENVSSTFGFYPDRPVAIGDSWTAQHAMNMGVPFTIDATYTLRSVEGTTALLDATYAVSSPDSSDGLDLNGMTMTLKMGGTMQGTVRLDLVSGMMEETTMDMNLSADATLTPAMGTQTLDMQMTMDGTTRSTLSPVEPSDAATARR